MSGLSERDVQRLVREVCPCGSDRAHDPARDLECDWSLRMVKSVAASRVLAERDAAIRDEAKTEALAPIRALADEFRREADKADKRSDGVSYARRTAWDRAADRLFALLDGGDQL